MEIKIRGLSKETVAKIDELAKQKGLSRNEYLKGHLETFSNSNKLLEVESRYSILMQKTLKVLNYNTLALNKFLQTNLIDLEEVAKKNYKENI
ncbi:hypothetical protein [Clostridium faecium]|uniref:Ribbon-helix-helix protein, CopG family n=1 Tax=Clostridium faecium TaxID=2762223 RepID=A0ABR8YP63_9CLOT|nr:hypothetical protein [Clostridium faecium]MBD8045803.1 hypothetical protein [Clostridium faecium]